MARRIEALRSADLTHAFNFPSAAAERLGLSAYTATMLISADENSAALLTLTKTTTAAGSSILILSPSVGLLIKATDLNTLPAGTPWVGFYRINLTSSLGVTTQLDSGPFELGGAA